MEKKIKITPPEGYEIDKENSTFECIRFKPIVKEWRKGNWVVRKAGLDIHTEKVITHSGKIVTQYSLQP